MTRRSLVLLTVGVTVAAFALAGVLYKTYEADRQARTATAQSDHLVRPHAPVIGPMDAPVTIVEFFDPSCETCRAFYPYVKKILADYPKEVRLVLRYAPFHEGSDQVVKLLETARLQNKFEPVLEALLATQPAWAIHGAPNLKVAWDAARSAGLDVDRAQRDMLKPEIDAVLKQDIADIKTVNLSQTPTFFVNAKPLPSFGPEQLSELVKAEVEQSRLSTASQ
jgi:protein-disulfide isomerase